MPARPGSWSSGKLGGLSVEESAEVLQVSVATVKRDWQMAKLWLLRELDLADSSGPRSRT